MNTYIVRPLRKLAVVLIIPTLLIIGIGYSFTNAGATNFWQPLKSYFSGTVVYVATIEDEVTALETELAQLAEQIANGDLTEDEAIEIQTKIFSRIDTINKNVAKSEAAEFTPEMKATISAALARLENVLIDYRDSLVVLDDIVAGPTSGVAETDKPRLNAYGSRSASKSVIAAITIATENIDELVAEVEEQVEYIPEEEVVVTEEVTESTEEEVISSDESSDEVTETDEGTEVDETDTETDEDVTEETTVDDDSTVEETETDEAEMTS